MLVARVKKLKKPHQKCQSENYNSRTPSGASSEAITVANEMHRTTLLNFLNTGYLKNVDVFTMLLKHYIKIELESNDANFVRVL